MQVNELRSAIEAILFASGDPVDINKISQALNSNKNIIRNILDILIDKFDSNTSGICILRLNDKYQMCSKTQYAEYVKKIMNIKKNVSISQAGMEVLAIIAYNQPVTKSFIEQIRGVDCSGIISNLNSKGLIEERGRLELPGRPLLYGTTSTFLRSFQIQSINELPNIKNQSEEI